MNDSPVVRYEVADGVATLTLDSPHNRNALSTALVEALESGLVRAEQDDAVRAVLLTHAGGTFCAGVDLRAALEVGMEQTSRRMVALLRRFVAHRKPVVARIDGHVRAAGLGLVAACDIVVAGPASTFAFTETRLGLAPAIISTLTSPRLSNRAAARYYLTGETFDAQEAATNGLVTIATDDPVGQTRQILDALLLCPPQGLEESKRLTNRAMLAGLDADGDTLAALSARLFASPQAREAMASFTQRRSSTPASTPASTPEPSPASTPESSPEPSPVAPRLIGDLVEYWARHTPDAPAITYEDRTFSWAQWAHRIRRAAGALRSAGIGPGDRVAFLDKNHPACLEVTLAAGSIGAACAVVNWRLAPDELSYVLGDCSPRIVVVGAELLPALDEVRDRLTSVEAVQVVGGASDTYEAWIGAATPLPAVDSATADSATADSATADSTTVQPDDTALILYTSGTTGFPKGALLTHRGLLCHTLACGAQFPMSAKAGDHNLVAMPLFHVGGSCYALIGFHAGVPTTLLREVSGPALVRSVLGGATHAFLVPAVIAGLVQAGPAALQPMSRLKRIGYGASPAPLPVLLAAMAAWPQTDFLQVYGMTELSGVVLTLSPQAHRDADHPERLSSAGVPLEGVRLRVVDPVTLDDVTAGKPGELWFLTEQRMAGYLGKPDATGDTITPEGWVRSGDVGRLDDGGFVVIEDRVKDMIITGGENVYGPEVERVLVQHPTVADVAVVGVPDETWGEAVLAFVQPADGASVDPDELIAYAREHLAAYKVPRRIETLEVLPRNPTGKVLKRQLRQPFWEGTGRRI